ncbi:DUF5518 domain-containing protein [Natrinema versiforme]|uniref:Uncharacterized protein n=1 Tax=Natrinema versiforme JCM 10478 TaxID=1227496 RepID=L9Y334_9EURY|nr:DUF5518 domain-containing protein [Natrinema versiforme]ELY68460.1 hypothetical protein C489_07155 [Natrinema versiforme JCM 10478]
MFRLRYWRSLLADDSWRYAIVGGLLAVPFVARSYQRTGTGLEFESLFVAGLLVGYFFRGPTAAVSRVGSRTGVVGALPALLWMLSDTIVFLFAELGSPYEFRLVQFGFVIMFGMIGVLIAAVTGAIGARIGNWLRGKFGVDQSTVVAQ